MGLISGFLVLFPFPVFWCEWRKFFVKLLYTYFFREISEQASVRSGTSKTDLQKIFKIFRNSMIRSQNFDPLLTPGGHLLLTSSRGANVTQNIGFRRVKYPVLHSFHGAHWRRGLFFNPIHNFWIL